MLRTHGPLGLFPFNSSRHIAAPGRQRAREAETETND